MEAAIRVLEEYLKHVERARRIMSRLRGFDKAYGIDPRRAIEMMMAQSIIESLKPSLPSETTGEEEAEAAPSEEVTKAVERLRNLAEKEKSNI